MPTHTELTYRKNFDRHTRRLKDVAQILADHDISLGLEYVGPKTLMTRDKYSFIRTMSEVQELISAIDEPNVGIQLDTFHWYCAGETEQDILNLDPKSIITVDLNDAKVGRSPDEQLDWEQVPLNTDRPPFGGNEGEYRALFADYFHIDVMEEANNSIPPRMGNELFIKMQRSKL